MSQTAFGVCLGLQAASYMHVKGEIPAVGPLKGFLHKASIIRPSINYSSHDPIPLNTKIDTGGQTEAQNNSHESYPSNSKRVTEIYVFFAFALCIVPIVANIGKY
jgi:hypothetical protein